MTTALCLNCGEMKFGAICNCPECGTGSTGDMRLDTGFTDHNWSESTLKQLGKVLKEISAHCDDARTCLITFLCYVHENHPEVLDVPDDGLRLPAEMIRELDATLAKCTLPDVVVEKSAERKRKDGG